MLKGKTVGPSLISVKNIYIYINKVAILFYYFINIL